jgi:aspartate-semialdehyde dehydrogenase
MIEPLNVAVVGATTLVGETLIQLLEERQFPVAELFLLTDDEESTGRIEFKGKHLRVGSLEKFDFSQVQLAFFCAGPDVSGRYVDRAIEAGCKVIDQSSRFRHESDVPLVVPEVNGETTVGAALIASPGCAAIALSAALKPLHDAVGIKRVDVTTLQAVSGRGKKGIEELATQTVALLNMRGVEPGLFPRQIAFNVIPEIEAYEPNGYTLEEMKVTWELRRLLGEGGLAVHVTAVRVPVFYGHSASVRIETKSPLSVEAARQLLSKAPGVKLQEGEVSGDTPTPVTEGAGNDEIWVGRLRQDHDDPNGLALWVVTDNIRKGGALNALQIAERMTKYHL